MSNLQALLLGIKKKYTKRNTIMAFVTVEDLYGSIELVVFDSVYSKCNNLLVNESIVMVEGRLSLKEDEEPRIIVKEIKDFENTNSENLQKRNLIRIDVTELNDEHRNKLKGAIKFFSGDYVNCKIEIIDKTDIKPCGAIYMTDNILEQIKEIVRS